ncbi:MAG: cytochrome c oxidase subunit II [Thermoleophilaceae bacterium]
MEEPTQDVSRFSRREMVKMFAIGTGASIIGIVIVLLIDWFPAQSSTAAEDIDTLWDVVMITAVPIFVLVMTVAIYSVVRFRAKPGNKGDGPPIHGNTKLEIIWVTIPFIIVTALAIYSWVVLDDIEAKADNEMVVDVTGQQFAWTFRYPAADVDTEELVLPVDRRVKFNIRTADVIHSFWVPEFRMKQDAVRGITTSTRVTPSRTGSWQIVCAELCGIGHSTMRQRVRVVPEAEFESFLAEQRAEGEESGGGLDPAQGGEGEASQ